MTKHRSHSAAFKRQVAQEFIAGETLHSLSKRHDVSRQLIRIWVSKYEAGGLDDDVQAADLLQEYEAKIAALERLRADLSRKQSENQQLKETLAKVGAVWQADHAEKKRLTAAAAAAAAARRPCSPSARRGSALPRAPRGRR